MSDPITFSIYPLQTEVLKRLQSHAYLSDVKILTEEKGDIENEIQRSLGNLTGVDGKIGLCIVILTPTATSKSPNAPGPLLDGLSLVISVIENVLVNQSDQGTKKHAIEIVELVLRYLHRGTVPGTNAALRVAARPFALTNSDPLTYEVNFITSLCLKPEP